MTNRICININADVLCWAHISCSTSSTHMHMNPCLQWYVYTRLKKSSKFWMPRHCSETQYMSLYKSYSMKHSICHYTKAILWNTVYVTMQELFYKAYICYYKKVMLSKTVHVTIQELCYKPQYMSLYKSYSMKHSICYYTKAMLLVDKFTAICLFNILLYYK